MKKALRLVALMLAIATLALTMLACGDDAGKKPDSTNSGVTNNSENVGGDDSVKPNVPDGLDFGGYGVRFIVSGGDTDEGDAEPGESGLQSRSIYVDPEVADMGYNVNKAVAERNKKVEETLNVKIIHEKGVGMQSLANELNGVLQSGLDAYDVVAGYQYFDLGIAFGDNAGRLLNYSKIDESEMYIDVNKPYWDTETYNLLGYGGANYWITGDLSQAWVGTMFVSFVNTELWQTYAKEIEKLTGYTDIYDVVENGKWTLELWSQLGEVVYIDKNNNEKVDAEDQTAFVTHADGLNGSCADPLAAGAHVTYTKWVDGVPTADFLNKHNQAFASALSKLAKESKTYVYEYGQPDTYQEHFTKGQTLICAGSLAMAEDYFADMDKDYYVVPAPKLNEAQDRYYTTLGDNVSHYAIPASCPQVGAVTATLELMGYYSWLEVTPAYYEMALKTRYVRGDLNKAAAMIDKIHEGIYTDFVWMYSNQCDNVTWYFRQHFSDKRFSSSARPKQTAVSKALEKLLANLSDSAQWEN